MRIQHNITAMNSYRNFNTNSSRLSKNLEKLSSGYKINRAGDDAAGLAISEKMRAQITGLEGATKNAKDGISLIQTAEGALTEVHDMLNRMTTLAEQSANGTYQNELDREQLQKEVQALKDEIDRVADSTNFNGLKLLDGSLSDKFSTTTVKDSALTNIESTDFSPKGTAAAFSVENVLARPESNANQTGAMFSVDLSDVSMNGLAANDVLSLKIGQTTLTAKVTTPPANAADLATLFAQSGGTAGTNVSGATYAAPVDTSKWDTATTGYVANTTNANSANNKYIKIDNHYYEMSTTGNKINFKQVDKMADNSANVEPNYGVELKVDGGNTSSKYVGKYIDASNTERGQDPQWHVTETTTGKAKGTSNQARAEVNIDFSKLQDGDVLIAGDKKFRFAVGKDSAYGANASPAYSAPSGETVIDLSGILKGEEDMTSSAKQEEAMATIVAQMGTTFGTTPGSGSSDPVWSVGDSGVSDDVGKLTFQSYGAWVGDTTTATADDKYIGGDTAADKINLTTEAGVRAQFIATSTEKAATTSFDLDVTKIKAGDTFTIDGKTFEFTDGEKASNKNNVAVDLSSIGITNGLAESDRSAVVNKLKTVIEGNGTTIDPALKLDNGNKRYKMSADGNRITLTSQEDAGTSKFESRVSAKIETPTETKNGEGLVLQIGDTAESYNKLTVSIEDMHSSALGIGDLDISTQEGAAAALDKIKAAINSVSDTRGNMGALQNRLDHTINNLGVMRENIQSAESVIRDTDVAEEMMTYTKNNILNQSAQAMLAQANQLPQGVLQLLG